MIVNLLYRITVSVKQHNSSLIIELIIGVFTIEFTIHNYKYNLRQCMYIVQASISMI